MGREADLGGGDKKVRKGPIVLKKSSFSNDRIFSGPLMRLSRCEVGDVSNTAKAIAGPLIASKSFEIAKALHLRDFRSPKIFEFFNTIGQ